MQNAQKTNWLQTLSDNINALVHSFGLDESQANLFRDFVMTTARSQYQVGNKSGARWAFKKMREEAAARQAAG
jgi:hypothetical protein